MKTILITYDQAQHENVIEALDASNCRGYTYLPQVGGRGSKTGEPHLGSHAWPSMNSAIITCIEDHQADSLLERLRMIDEENPMLGLRAFQWNVERYI